MKKNLAMNPGFDYYKNMKIEIAPEQIQTAREWILDCSVDGIDQEDRELWLEDASDVQVRAYVNRTFCGGWGGFLKTL